MLAPLRGPVEDVIETKVLCHFSLIFSTQIGLRKHTVT